MPKFDLTSINLKFLKQRFNLSLILSLLYGIPIGVTIQRSLWVTAAFSICGFIVTLFARDVRAFFILQVVTGALLTFVIYIYGLFVPDYKIVISTLITLFVGLYVLLVILWRKLGQPNYDAGTLACLSTVSSVIWWVAAKQGWTSLDGIKRISMFAEDSGAYLGNFAIASGPNFSTAIMSRAASENGGTALGTFQTTLMGFMRLLPNNIDGRQYTALVMWRFDIYILLLISTLAAIVSIGLIMAKDNTLKFFVGITAVLTASSFTLGFISLGHTSVLVVIAVGLGGIATSLSFRVNSQKWQWVATAISSITFLMIAESWYVATVAAVVFLGFLLLNPIRLFVQGNNWMRYFSALRNDLRKFVGLCLLIGGFTWLAWKAFNLSFLKSITDLNHAKAMMSYGGGIPSVSSTVSVAILVLCAFYLISKDRLQVEQHVSQMVASLICVATGLLVLAYLVPPYAPQYGPSKNLIVSAAILCPVAIGFLGRVVSDRGDNGLMRGVAVATSVLLLMISTDTPLGYLNTVLVEAQGAEWAAGVAKVMEQTDRKIACIENDENVGEYGMYVCSRMVAGMQGTHKELASLILTAGNICAIDSIQLIDQVKVEEWGNYAFILGDGSRFTNGYSCQARGWRHPLKPVDMKYTLGWLTGVRWDLVEYFDRKGNPATPSFENLRVLPGYEDPAIVDQLEELVR